MKKLNKKGFTLIELIVVIAIIAALMLILVPTMNGFVNTAKQQANQANAKAVYTAIKASDTADSAGMTLGSRTAICGTGTAYSQFWEGTLPTGVTCTYTDGKVTVENTGTVKNPGIYPQS